jgi:Flp pilus assembly protein TadD
MRRARLGRTVAALVAVAVSLPAQDTGPAQNPAAVAAFRAGQEAFKREDFEAAIAQFKAAIAADPRLAAAHCALGQAYMTLRRYPEAVEALVACKATTERQAAAQASGRAEQMREIDREISELRQSIAALRSGQVKSNSPELTIVRLEERLRRLEEGRSAGLTGASGIPAAIPFALGTAYLRVGSLDLAEKELREAVRIKPDLGEAHNNLAAIYARTGRWDEAATHVRLAEAAGFAVPPALKADVAARRGPPAGSPATGAPAPAPAPVPAPTLVETAVAVEHTPLACVSSGVFPRIEAHVTPAGAATAKVFFRASEHSGWYAVRLRSEDEVYSALLPRPRSTASFRYYVEVTGEDTKTARTPEYVTKVVDRPEQCGAQKAPSAATASSILVEPPKGAPENQPVPQGFSARGTVGDIGQFEMGTKVAIGAGVVVAGAAVAGVVAAAGKETQFSTTTIPVRPDLGGDIALVSSNPAPGGTISVSGTVVAMTFRAVAPFAVPAGPATVIFSRSGGFITQCATLTGSHPGLVPNEPITLTLTGHVVRGEFCGDQFDARIVRVFLRQASGPQILSTGTAYLPDLPLAFSFVP